MKILIFVLACFIALHGRCVAGEFADSGSGLYSVQLRILADDEIIGTPSARIHEGDPFSIDAEGRYRVELTVSKSQEDATRLFPETAVQGETYAFVQATLYLPDTRPRAQSAWRKVASPSFLLPKSGASVSSRASVSSQFIELRPGQYLDALAIELTVSDAAVGASSP